MKRHADGSVECYKARLVAKGFHQQHVLDYDETFNPVIKPTTVHLVLSIIVSKGWCIRQADVKNAFLNGALQETVFMKQPPGFVTSTQPQHVCRLQKALYGLKQPPRPVHGIPPSPPSSALSTLDNAKQIHPSSSTRPDT